MKKGRKIISVVLCAVMLFSTLCVGALASGKCTCGNDPIVYVYGRQSLFVFNEDGTKTEQLRHDNIDIGAIAKEIMPYLSDAIKTDDWTAYCDKLFELIAPAYDEIRVDGNGHPLNENTGVEFSWSPETVSPVHSYHFGNSYSYSYDWRLSPLDVADDLNAYIECVKEKTGHDKVVLVSRCMGTNYAAAYLGKYERPRGYSGISATAWLNGALNGMDWLESLFSGTVVLDPDSTYRYIENLGFLSSMEDKALAEVLQLTLNSFKETYGFAGACKFVEKKFYPEIKDMLIARLIRYFYGTTGGSLSMVKDRFEESINTIFPTDEDKAEYATVIAKATEYHDTITMQAADMLKEMEAAGKPVGIFAEYGGQQYPLSEKAPYCGDSSVTLEDQSFGATTSKINEKLPESYIEARTAEGLAKYISPDKQVDASTCLFPDTTWFFKNAHHTYPEAIHYVILWFIRGVKPTVDADPAYPQFMNYNEAITDLPTYKQLSPAQEVNENDIDWSKFELPKGEATASLLIRAINAIRDFIQKIINFIKEIVGIAKA